MNMGDRVYHTQSPLGLPIKRLGAIVLILLTSTMPENMEYDNKQFNYKYN